MGWFCLVCFLFILLSSPLLIFSREDRLTLGMSISGNQIMISAGGTFALGFFSPGKSTNHYLGIWYHKIAPQTVVWVANREVPLMKNSPGTFMLTDEGNLVVFHGSRKNVIWSSNVSSVVVTGNNSVGLLTDKGNLIMTDIEEGNVLWESFNYPSDTILPGMKFGLNLKNGHNNRLISWNKGDDPAPGVFSYAMDTRGPVQMLIRKRSDIYFRSNLWDGAYVRPIPDYAAFITFNITDEGYYFESSVTDESLILRYMLDRDGKVNTLAWSKKTKKWELAWSFPTAECQLYNRCGPSGICNGNNTKLICGCLKGFRPYSQKDWDMGDHSSGCVRKEENICETGDGFMRFEKIKLPDNPISLSGNLSHRECENKCLRNCSCTAYVYANRYISGEFTSSCLNWDGNLMDLTIRKIEERDIYIRLARAELVGTGKIRKTRHTFTFVAATVAVGIFLFGSACYVLWRRRMGRREANTSEMNRQVYRTPGSPNKDTELFSFSLNSILAATNHFSMENKLGEGGFGTVFKGSLPDGEEIAIKRLSKMSGQGLEELMNELTLIAQLQHTNLVRLVGCCIEGEEKMLIYEYMPNKSLDTFLFDPTKQANFSWYERFHIIEGIAQGLLYLHKYSRVKIIHRDLKASNILLDGAMNPKISDFGMARIFGGNQSQANTQRVVGTYGYMSPEYALNGLFSEKSDVFSFGVLLIEIVTGKKNSGFYPTEKSVSLLGYAWQLWGEGRVTELMDTSVRHSLISHDEVAKCIHVGLLCVQEDANHWPTMSSVVSILANDTINLPVPQAPTFFTRISTTTVVASSSSSRSINEVTLPIYKRGNVDDHLRHQLVLGLLIHLPKAEIKSQSQRHCFLTTPSIKYYSYFVISLYGPCPPARNEIINQRSSQVKEAHGRTNGNSICIRE